MKHHLGVLEKLPESRCRRVVGQVESPMDIAVTTLPRFPVYAHHPVLSLDQLVDEMAAYEA